jgi:ATP-dependent Clp protease protease subunit
MEDVNLKERNLILGDYVNQGSVKDLIKAITDINTEDAERESKTVGYVRAPIKLYVNTYGGSCYDGLGLINSIEQSKTPVHTICSGMAMSMGFYIMLSGHKRFTGKYSTFMWHELSMTEINEKLEGMKMEVAEGERLQKIFDDMVVNKTKILRSQIEDVRTKKKDWYIPAQEAFELGIVDELL